MKPTHNSLVVPIRDLLKHLELDFISLLGTHSKDISRDFKTIQNRLEHEGITFVTSTLPALGKAIISSFLTGRLKTPLGFKTLRGTTLPTLFSGLLVQGWNSEGMLKDDCPSLVVKLLLQACFLFYKLKLPFTKEQRSRKLKAFIEAECDLRALNLDARDDVLQYAQTLLRLVFKGFDPKDISPQHGPGALATGEKQEEKWRFKRKYKNLHAYYPYYEYFTASRGSLLSNIKWYRDLERADKACSKVVLVPKDSRGPRVISMEPLELQFIQQGLKKALYTFIESNPYTKGFVNFSDQTINGALAVRGSKDGSVATLDMKEASDRVSMSLVNILFWDTPLLKALQATRSQSTLIKDKELNLNLTVELMKYAPMGSATCFPIEALVFWALAQGIIAEHEGRLNVFNTLASVYVYGDDIIVANQYASVLKKRLPDYGLLVNTDKSFDAGPFRESCGSDAFKGDLVTPIKLKELWPQKKRVSATVLQAYVDYAKGFRANGYTATYAYMASLLQQLLPEKPAGSLAGLGLPSVFANVKWKRDEATQASMFRSMQIQPKKRVSHLYRKLGEGTPLSAHEGAQRLFMNLLGVTQPKLEVPYASTYKLRWMTYRNSSVPGWAEELTRRCCYFDKPCGEGKQEK